MSANATQLLVNLRELISDPTVNLLALARTIEVSYDKLRRLKLNGHPLSLEDTEKLHFHLTGKTFITLENV